MPNYLSEIVEEVRQVLEKIDTKEIDEVESLIQKNRRIFVDGEGRSGYVGQSFAMRLMHLGFEVYVMGESTTPGFEAGDVYISISRSGNTGAVVLNAEKAKKAGATLVTITNNRDSALGELSDAVIGLEATVRSDKERQSIQLLGSLFDQSVHLLVDDICLRLSKREAISNDEATGRHV